MRIFINLLQFNSIFQVNKVIKIIILFKFTKACTFMNFLSQPSKTGVSRPTWQSVCRLSSFCSITFDSIGFYPKLDGSYWFSGQMVTDLGQTAGLAPTAQHCTTSLVDTYTCNYKGYSGCLRYACVYWLELFFRWAMRPMGLLFYFNRVHYSFYIYCS